MLTKVSEKKKLLILLPNLVGAGGQRAVLNLFLALDRTRFEPRLLVQERIGSFVSEVEGMEDVDFLLDRAFSRADLPFLIRETTRHAKRADIVLAGLEGRASFCGLVAAKLARKPVVAWIHIDWRPFVEQVSWRQTLSLKSYALVDHVVACSVGAATNFAQLFSVPPVASARSTTGFPWRGCAVTQRWRCRKRCSGFLKRRPLSWLDVWMSKKATPMSLMLMQG